MKTKYCPKCDQNKKLSDFYKKNKKYYHPYCKGCFNKYCSIRWIQKKIEAIKYLGSKCNDCTITYPEYPYVVFDFHHLDPEIKSFNWDKLKLQSQDTIFKELDKCILLCSNCHRIKHHHLVPSEGLEPPTFPLEEEHSSS